MEENKNEQQASTENTTQENPTQVVEEATQEQAEGGSQNKAIAAIGYLIPILFFIPLLSDKSKKDTFAMFHANQHLNFLLYWIVLSIIAIIPILGWIVWFVGWIFGIVLIIMGIINASSGKTKALPLIGSFTLLK